MAQRTDTLEKQNRALELENQELRRLLAKAKDLLQTYHEILQQPEYAAAAAAPRSKPRRKPAKKRAAPRKSAKKRRAAAT